MQLIISSLLSCFHWQNLLGMVLGLGVGLFVGAMPGLSGVIGISLLLPFTFGMEPTMALLMLVGTYCGATYAGSISAILIKTPGTAAAAATVLDGYQMNLKGRAQEALSVALYASVFGGLFSGLVLLTVAPQLAKVALKFNSADYFMLAVFELSVISAVGGKSICKGLVMACFGVFASTIGIDPTEGVYRFTFGTITLSKGIALVPALIGLFAISELLNQTEKLFHAEKVEQSASASSKYGWKHMWRYKWTMLKSAVIGVVIGATPGTGAAIASFMAYGEAKRCSKHPEEYGHGCPEAVAASESANNGVTGATLIPMLTLGIPGDVITAVLMGALMIQGLNPGPQLFTQHADMTYTVIVGFLIVNILMLYMGKLAIRAFGQVCKVPYSVLLPVVLAFCLVGAYACSNSIYDCLIAIVFGVIGYLAEKFDFSTTPMLIGLVLGSLAEQNLIRTLTSSQGSLSVFVQRPISLLFIILTVLFVGYNLYSRHKQKKLERSIRNN